MPAITPAKQGTSDSLWSAAEIAEFKNLDALRKLFKGEHSAYFVLEDGTERKIDYLVINWLGDLLSQTWKRFLFRKFPTIKTQDPVETAFINSLDLPTIALPGELRKSYAGTAIYKCYYSNLVDRPVFSLWGANEGEYTTFEYLGGDTAKPYAVSFWYTRIIPGTDNEKAMIRERWELLVDETLTVAGVQMKSTAHTIQSGTPSTEEMDWGKVWNGIPNPPEQTLPELPYTDLPVVVIHNFDRNGDGYGDTDYTPSLIAIQKNINKLAAIRQAVIDLSEIPMIEIPPEYMNRETGEVDWNRVKLRIKFDGEEGNEIKITNWTGNLENSDKQWTFYREEFYALTGISPSLAGTADSQARSGLARRYAFISTEAEIESRRHQWNLGFRKLVKIAKMVQNQWGDTKLPEVEEEKLGVQTKNSFTVKWSEVIPYESAEKSNMLTNEYQTGGRTLNSLVRNLPLNEDMSEEDLLVEIAELVKKEEENAKLSLPPIKPGGTPPTEPTGEGNQKAKKPKEQM
jgi:hypothetical protein